VRWINGGSAVAAVLWLGASGLFAFHASNFGKFNETYGSLGAIIGFMTWLWISAIVILLGAEINAEMEHQTARDTPEAAPKPMGTRAARVARRKADESGTCGRKGWTSIFSRQRMAPLAHVAQTQTTHKPGEGTDVFWRNEPNSSQGDQIGRFCRPACHDRPDVTLAGGTSIASPCSDVPTGA
jgi:hypothetical protein